MSETSVRLTEIFFSLQGEARNAGCPTVFIRLTGCPLRCQYCDTEYAFHGGQSRSLNRVLEEVADFNTRYVCVTGGEPLAQPGCLPLLKRLCDSGYDVSLETSGALPIEDVDTRVSRVVDIKTPGSKEVSKNRFENVQYLTQRDQVKFVICDRRDYEWSRLKLHEYELCARVGEVLFSPSFNQLPAVQLAEWILEDRLPVRFQLQQHKLLWGEERGH